MQLCYVNIKAGSRGVCLFLRFLTWLFCSAILELVKARKSLIFFKNSYVANFAISCTLGAFSEISDKSIRAPNGALWQLIKSKYSSLIASL